MDQNLLQKYLDIAGVIFVALDTEGKITLINKKGCRVLGYEEGELVGKDWFETCIPKKDREKIRQVFAKIGAGELIEYYDNQVVTKSGGLRRIAWQNTLLKDDSGKYIGTLSSGLDMTKRQAIEKSLQESEARIHAIVENAVDAIITINEKGIIETVNPAVKTLFGYDRKELIGKNVAVLMPAPYREEHDEYLKHYLKTGVKKIIGIGREVTARKKDGKSFPARLSVSEFFFDDKRMFTGILQDISHEKRTEQALRESEAQMRAIVETAVDAIITIDEEGIIHSMNSSVQRLFGYTKEELLGENIKTLMPSPYHDEHDDYLINYLNTGEKKIIGIGREVLGKRKDGRTFPIRLSVSEFFLGNKRMFTGVINDISEQKSLQQQILQSERLAVIGKMAAKVAHEVRNPLSSISLNAELLEDEIQSDGATNSEEATSLLQAIIREIDRVTSLTDEYLQFSRMPQSQLMQSDLNQLIKEAIEQLNRELGSKKISIKYYGVKTSLVVKFDRSQMRRVLVNIIRNAIESMPDGGKLAIHSEKTETAAVLTIEDSGIGIPEDKVEQIFEPFFTTKDFGTGLGLAISQQIINEHNGRILCDSTQGVGTQFKIELPLDQN